MYSLDSSQALNKNGHCHTHFQWMYSNLPTSNSISWQPPSSKYCHFLKASTNRLCTNLFHKWVGLTKRNLLSSCKSARRRTPGRPSTCPGWVGAVNTTKATVVLSLNVSYTFIHHLLYYKHGAWCVFFCCCCCCCCCCFLFFFLVIVIVVFCVFLWSSLAPLLHFFKPGHFITVPQSFFPLPYHFHTLFWEVFIQNG